ncbi:MAG: hypothetical protein RLZZ458_1209, partial [Planctomycetota bacterium]
DHASTGVPPEAGFRKHAIDVLSSTIPRLSQVSLKIFSNYPGSPKSPGSDVLNPQSPTALPAQLNLPRTPDSFQQFQFLTWETAPDSSISHDFPFRN